MYHVSSQEEGLNESVCHIPIQLLSINLDITWQDIKQLYEKALRLKYKDNQSSFKELSGLFCYSSSQKLASFNHRNL